jgi:demethylmenaquinone methyltransferase/2-methoxy-6-polyprenyl-1,4-benzoquinol methylase
MRQNWQWHLRNEDATRYTLPLEDFVYETFRGAIGDTIFEAVQKPRPRTIGRKDPAKFFECFGQEMIMKNVESVNRLMEVGDGFKIIKTPQYQNKIPELYRHLAWIYDFFTDHEPAHHEEAIRVVGFENYDSVLEVACGTGRATVEIAKRLKRESRFYAIDLTKEMMERAQKKLQRYDLLDRVAFKVGDAKHLPFHEGMFDVVYNSYMFDLIDTSDMPKIISEFKRVLKPGGTLVLVNMSKDKKKKTLYEVLYERGLLSFASGGCRPVFMKPLLEDAQFMHVKRIYRKNKSFFLLNRLHGTEIVTANKPDVFSE